MDNKESTAAAAAQEEVSEWGNLLFDVRRSIRYHSKRADYYRFWAKFATAISLICGSGVVATTISKDSNASIALGATTAIASIIILVFGYPEKERLHEDLKRKFSELEIRMTKCESQSEKNLKDFTAERLRIEEDEPEVISALNTVCHNELVTAQGSGKKGKIPKWREIFCQYNFPGHKPELE
ncbi:MAG: hypothetical protein LBC75_01125 [Fibromonadaceae bacterium]|jgi:disulfide oxidoreductase YuzD|nr:hypothetical protein [Fibromonadaceae bacterium]